MEEKRKKTHEMCQNPECKKKVMVVRSCEETKHKWFCDNCYCKVLGKSPLDVFGSDYKISFWKGL